MSTTNTSELDTTTISFGVSAAAVIVFNAILTLGKESYPPLLAFMKAFSVLGVKHHWLLHGLTVVILFFIMGAFISKIKNVRILESHLLTSLLVWSTVLGSLAIFGFFLNEIF
jgi:hypothetical protein